MRCNLGMYDRINKTRRPQVKLKKAIELVLNEAEVSAIGNKDNTQLETLEAVKLLREFYFRYGYFFDNFDENIDINNYMVIQKPPTDKPNE